LNDEIDEIRKIEFELRTDIETSFPVEIASVDGDGQIDIAGGIDAGHNTNGSILIDVLSNDILRIKTTDDSSIGAETWSCHVDHHTAHHVATFRGKHKRL
jgi:hypothetical protein